MPEEKQKSGAATSESRGADNNKGKQLLPKKDELLKLSEVSLILDTYDDIFSDFDPRPYSERALSDDFLYEAKKATKQKASGQIELKFMIPKLMRDANKEGLIRKRLHEHFRKHHDSLHKEIRTQVKKGACFAGAGMALMIATTLMLYFKITGSFLLTFLTIMFEPASWFMFWEGLRLIIFENKPLKIELDFYEKMSKCEISFLEY